MIVQISDLIEFVKQQVVGNYKYLYIAGAGCAGKTTLASAIVENSTDSKINLIATDNFLVDANLRRNVKLFSSERVTSFCREAYFMPALDATFCALRNNMSQWIPNYNHTICMLNEDCDLTIVEGVGAAFLQPENNSFRIFIDCAQDEELKRRKKRDGLKFSISDDKIEADSVDRRKQYHRNILIQKLAYDLILFSNSDFSFTIIQNNTNFFQ